MTLTKIILLIAFLILGALSVYQVSSKSSTSLLEIKSINSSILIADAPGA